MSREFVLTLESRGRVPLPLGVLTALRLLPGDLLSVRPAPLSLRLDLYAEFLTDNWDAVSPVNRWRYVEDFLRRPLVAVEKDGTLEISPDLMILHPGESVILEVVGEGLFHTLYLRRKP
jgi:hypothetical protein